MKKNLLSAVIFSLLWLVISSAHALMVKTDPEIINPIKIGDTFNLNVNVEGASDLAEFQFYLTYNTDTTVVIPINFVFSNFLESTGRTIVDTPEMPGCRFDNDEGTVFCSRNSKGEGIAGPSGNGTLVTITFQVKKSDHDFLNIRSATLTNTKGDKSQVAMLGSSEIIPALGNIDGKGAVNLSDAILGLRILAGINISPQTITLCADVNNDNKIGIEEVVYILQYIAELR